MRKPYSNIPITIAVKGKKMLKIAELYTDIIEFSYLLSETINEVSDKIQRSLDVIIGRNEQEEAVCYEVWSQHSLSC